MFVVSHQLGEIDNLPCARSFSVQPFEGCLSDVIHNFCNSCKFEATISNKNSFNIDLLHASI